MTNVFTLVSRFFHKHFVGFVKKGYCIQLGIFIPAIQKKIIDENPKKKNSRHDKNSQKPKSQTKLIYYNKY